MTQAQTLARVLVLLVSLPLAASAQQKTTLPAQDKLLREKPTQLYSVGAEDGEEWELLAGVRGVAFDQKDNLYVLDGNNYRVLVFDANGKFVRQISKKGGGPGELLAPISMTVTVDGTVVVSDLGRRAYSLFGADGKFLRNVTYDEEGGGPGAIGRGLRAHPKGGVVGQIRDMPGLRMMGGAGRGREGASPDQLSKPIASKTEINWFDLKSAKPTTMYAVDAPTITPKVDDSGSAGGERRMQVRISQPEFMPVTSFGVLPTGGLAVASQAAYRIEVINADCKVERVIERPIAPKKVTQRDKELAIKNRREGMSRGDGMVVMMNNNGSTSTSVGAAPPRGDLPSVEQMLRETTFMDVIPVLRRIETDPQGRIWIQRTAPDFGVRGPVDIVARDGRYIGTILNDRAPDAVSPSGRVAYIDRDELNVERVLVKKLPATWQ